MPYRAVNKSMFDGIDSIIGTPLDPENEDTIWEEISTKRVRLKPDTRITENAVQNIAGADFDRVWSIFRESLYTAREIMEGCFLGDDDCESAFYEKYKKWIRHAIRCRMQRYAAHVEDVSQDFLIELRGAHFAPFLGLYDINRPEGLIRLIARQYAGRYLQRLQMHNFIPLPEQDAMPEQYRGGRELDPDEQRILEEALSILSENSQNVFRLFRSDLPREEIAARTGLSVSNVNTILCRAMLRITNFVRRNYPEL